MMVCLVICLGLMWTDASRDHLKGVRRTIDYAVTPLRYVINAPFAFLNWTGGQLRSHNALIEENERLGQENFALRTRQQRLLILEQENQRLRQLLGSSSRVSERSLVAELLTVALDPYRQQIMINKGRHHEVYDGQPIISAMGIMGQVVHSGEFSSMALLISDPSHSIPVQSNRSGLRTIAQGTGKPDELELLHIPNSADIEVGDLMISTGLGGRFPSNYPVAYVTKIERNPGQPFASVFATPTAALDKASEVLLIWPQLQKTDLEDNSNAE